MQLFGREAPTPEDVWALVTRVRDEATVWRARSFPGCAKRCGLTRVQARAGYFRFEGPQHLTGQAPVDGGFIEELRLFIGAPPRNVSTALWEADQPKLKRLARSYVARFREELGRERVIYDNAVFTHDGFRVRVLAASEVWVVISKLEVLERLGRDDWARSEASARGPPRR